MRRSALTNNGRCGGLRDGDCKGGGAEVEGGDGGGEAG